MRAFIAEGIGTALLVSSIIIAWVVRNTLIGAAVIASTLFVLILVLGPVSRAHFNPAVTLADAWHGGLPWDHVGGYIASQAIGAALAVAVALLIRFR